MTETKTKISTDLDQQPVQYPNQYIEEDEINLIDLIYPVYKQRRFLFYFCLIVTTLTIIYALITPKIYNVTAVILPETKQSSGGELKAAFLQQFGMSGFGESSSTPAATFESILKSKYWIGRNYRKSTSNQNESKLLFGALL